MTHDNAIPMAPAMAVAPDKGFINVGGDEAGPFLQSLLTANIDLLEIGSCMPGALLTPQGRILFDMMIYRRDDGFIIESDAPRIDDLFTRLKRYRLRRPISLAIIGDLQTWVLWSGAQIPSGSFADPRHPTLGYRWLSDNGSTPDSDAVIVDIALWHQHRIKAGVPEGPIDLIPERALMLEAALDVLGAVDFTKGCYIGQEVTARTYYRGLVKRRLVPLMVQGGAPAAHSIITYLGKEIATSKTSAKANVAGAESWILALIKLSDIHAILAAPNDLLVGDSDAALAIPEWMIPLPDPARTDS